MADEMIDQERREFLGTSAVVLSGVVAGGAAMARAGTASAQSGAVKEPAVIGYPNPKGVTIERVTYPARNHGTQIVANLFRPAGFDDERLQVRGSGVATSSPFGGGPEGADGRPLRPAAGRAGLPRPSPTTPRTRERAAAFRG